MQTRAALAAEVKVAWTLLGCALRKGRKDNPLSSGRLRLGLNYPSFFEYAPD